MTVAVAVGSGALVPGWGEGSTTGTGWVGAGDGLLGGAVDGAGGAAGTATEGVPGLGCAGAEVPEADAAGVEATGSVLGTAGGATETVGNGPATSESAGPAGTAVQPATHRPKRRQAAVIAVVLFVPRPACMTARAPVRPPVLPTLGLDGGSQHAVRVTVRTRVGHARHGKAEETRMPPPRRKRDRGIKSVETKLLLLLRPERRSGARRCP